MTNEDYPPCECKGAGFCPRYGQVVPKNMKIACERSESYREMLTQAFAETDREESKRIYEEKIKRRDEANLVDQVIVEVEKEGVNAESSELEEGIGTVLENVFLKFGITSDRIEQWSGIGGCGCEKRKKFLNKILPFIKSDPSIAPKKKTQ